MKKEQSFKKIILSSLSVFMLLAGFVSYPVIAQQTSDYTAYQTLVERARGEGKAKELNLAECIELALKRNLTIELNRYQPLINQEQLVASLGAYDFTLTGEPSYSKVQRPITNLVNRRFLGDTFTGDTYQLTSTLNRYLPTGGTVSVSLMNDRQTTNSNAFNPTFDGGLGVSFTQPLWQNRQVDRSRREIWLAKKDILISDLEFENQVSTTVKNLQDVYWDLVNAIEQQRIQIQSRELALIQLRDNQRRVEIGTLAPITVTQTRAQLAQAEQAVIAAEANIILAENVLKFAILNDPKDPLWNQVIIPTDKPDTPEKLSTLDEAMDVAMKNRPELRELNIQLEKSDYDIKFYRNQTRPKLDFVASLTSNGVAGPTIMDPVLDQNGDPVLDPDGNPLMVPSKFTGKLGTVYKQMFSFDYVDYNLALNFQYIFGNRTAKAGLATARIAKDQNLTTLKQTIQLVQTEVINAIQTIEVNRKSLESAIVASQYQREQLDGQNKRFAAGLTTNFEVLQAQRDLASADASELTARINLRKAMVSLQKAMFTIIDQNQLEIASTR